MMSFTEKWMGLDGEQHENWEKKKARFRQILHLFYRTQNLYLKTKGRRCGSVGGGKKG